MKKIYYNLEIGYCGCGEEGITTVDDNLTDNDIDELVNEMAQEYASGWEGNENLAWDSEMSEEEYEEATQYFYENVCGSWRRATKEDIEDIEGYS